MRLTYLMLPLLLSLSILIPATISLAAPSSERVTLNSTTILTTSKYVTSTSATNTADISSLQSYVLGFVGQEAIAHAAAIFATLTAAFTFATGFKKTKTSVPRLRLYVLFLAVLLTGGIYSFLRAMYWAVLSNAVLNTGPSALSQLTQVCAEKNTLRDYWACVANFATNSNSLVGVLSLGSTIASFSISWALGFLSAVAVASYMSYTGGNFKKTFTALPWPFKMAFWGALIDYMMQITLVAGIHTGWKIVAISAGTSVVLAWIVCKITCWSWPSSNLTTFVTSKSLNLRQVASNLRRWIHSLAYN